MRCLGLKECLSFTWCKIWSVVPVSPVWSVDDFLACIAMAVFQKLNRSQAYSNLKLDSLQVWIVCGWSKNAIALSIVTFFGQFCVTCGQLWIISLMTSQKIECWMVNNYNIAVLPAIGRDPNLIHLWSLLAVVMWCASCNLILESPPPSHVGLWQRFKCGFDRDCEQSL